jgi:recombination protein RecA
MVMGSQPGNSLPGLSTGSLSLDLKLGSGGWPRGRIVEIFGPEGSGKTTLLLEAIGQALRNDRFGAFIDADHGLDPAAAERLGVTLEPRHLIRTNILEEAFEKIAELLKESFVEVIALDSIAALLPEEQRACSRDAVTFHKNENNQYRLEHFLKALLGPLSRSRAALLITNQVREKIGIMYGNPDTTPWMTLPLRDYASQRIDLRRITTIKDGDEPVGVTVRAKVVKNRCGAPLSQAEFELRFATGIDREDELLKLGLETGLLRKRGAHVYLDDTNLGLGSGNVVRRLRQDGELAARIREGVVERSRPVVEPVAEGDGP